MAEYHSSYENIVKTIGRDLLVEDINPAVQFVADQSGLGMLKLLGGIVPNAKVGTGFKTQPPMIRTRNLKSIEAKWIKQAVPERDMVLDGAHTTETTLAITTATYPRAAVGGTYDLIHPSTGVIQETVYLKTEAGSDNITVQRNVGGTTNAVLAASSILKNRSHIVSDYSTRQKVHDIDPTTETNNSETIRVDWDITLKGLAVEEYGDLNNPETIKRRKLYEFSKHINFDALFGVKDSFLDADNNRIQTMNGLTKMITTHLYQSGATSGFPTGHGAALTETKYRNTFLRKLTRFMPEDQNDMLILIGGLMEEAIDTWFAARITNVKQDELILGWNVATIMVNGKRFHHIFDASVDGYDPGMAIAFPKDAVTYRPTVNNGINLDKKHYEVRSMTQGGTKLGGFFMVDFTLELGWEQGCGVMSGVTSYS